MLDAESFASIGLNKYFSNPTFAEFDGTDYAIAILDSGWIKDTPELAGRVVYEQDFINQLPGQPPDLDASEDFPQYNYYGHGTQVASIAAGVAPGADLIILKTSRGDEQLNEHDANTRALQWVIENQDDKNIVAVNISWGDGENYQTDQAATMHHPDNVYADIYSELLRSCFKT